jgi:hypothetical protein
MQIFWQSKEAAKIFLPTIHELDSLQAFDNQNFVLGDAVASP